MQPTPAPQFVVLSPKQLSSQLGLSLVTLWRMRRDKQLPQPIQISAGRVGWVSTDIETWLADRKNQPLVPRARRRRQTDGTK